MSINVNSRPEFPAGTFIPNDAPTATFDLIYTEGGCLQPGHGGFDVSYPEDRAGTIAVRAAFALPKAMADIEQA